MTGCRYASERGEPTGRSTTPSRRTHKPSCHPISDTREASQLSDSSPHRGALQQAQRRRSQNTRPSATRWARPAGLRPAPKGCLAHGQPERSEWANRRESSLLERPSPPPAFDAQNRPTMAATGTHAEALVRGLGAAPRRARPVGPAQVGPRPDSLPNAQPSPLGHKWQALCVDQGADRQEQMDRRRKGERGDTSAAPM